MALARSSQDKVLGGVCAGIAHRYDKDPWLIRLLFIAALALPGPGILIYLLLWAFLPVDAEDASHTRSADSDENPGMVQRIPERP